MSNSNNPLTRSPHENSVDDLEMNDKRYKADTLELSRLFDPHHFITPKEQKLIEKLRQYDVDKSGALTFSEVTLALEDLAQSEQKAQRYRTFLYVLGPIILLLFCFIGATFVMNYLSYLALKDLSHSGGVLTSTTGQPLRTGQDVVVITQVILPPKTNGTARGRNGAPLGVIHADLTPVMTLTLDTLGVTTRLDSLCNGAETTVSVRIPVGADLATFDATVDRCRSNTTANVYVGTALSNGIVYYGMAICGKSSKYCSIFQIPSVDSMNKVWNDLFGSAPAPCAPRRATPVYNPAPFCVDASDCASIISGDRACSHYKCVAKQARYGFAYFFSNMCYQSHMDGGLSQYTAPSAAPWKPVTGYETCESGINGVKYASMNWAPNGPGVLPLWGDQCTAHEKYYATA